MKNLGATITALGSGDLVAVVLIYIDNGICGLFYPCRNNAPFKNNVSFEMVQSITLRPSNKTIWFCYVTCDAIASFLKIKFDAELAISDEHINVDCSFEWFHCPHAVVSELPG